MKCGVSIHRGHLLLFLALGVVLAGPALGVPVPITFNGPLVDGENRGVATPAPNVPILDIDVYSVVAPAGSGLPDRIEVVSQSASGMVVGSGSLLDVTSHWVVQDNYGAFPAPVYLVFSTAVNRQITTQDGTFDTDWVLDFDVGDGLDPDESRAGLVIDPAPIIDPNGVLPPQQGWRYIESEIDDNGQPLPVTYVGIRLDFDSTGAECGTDPASGQPVILADSQACVAVRYFLDNPEFNLFPDGPDQILGLPELKILMGVVPEPGTGSLLALGLVALAAQRRRRN